MDDADKQEIGEYFKVNSQNNHNLIENSNKQIIINSNFNKFMNTLKK